MTLNRRLISFRTQTKPREPKDESHDDDDFDDIERIANDDL